MLCATVIAPYMKKGVVPDPRHYMLRRPPRRQNTPEEIEAYLRAAFGGGRKKG